MARRPDEESGVLLDDYPRIQRRPDPVKDVENERQRRRPLRARIPRLPLRRFGAFVAVALVGAVLGWCVHPDAADTGGPARKALAETEARVEALEGELATATGALATEQTAAAKRIEDRAREVADLAAATKAIADKLAAAAGTHGEVVIAGADVRLVLGEKALFRPGEVELTATGLELLSSIGTALADDDVADRLLRVEGHTDDAPLPRPKPARPGKGGKPAAPVFASRWDLASARAVAVVRYLHEQVKLDPRRLGAATFAEHRPLGKNKAKNRRIELVLSAPPAEP